MMHRSELKFHKITEIAFSILLLAFLAFFIYLGLTENVLIESARPTHNYSALENYKAVTVEDPEAPVGIRKEYQWHIESTSKSENCICFYLVHHHASVYIDGECVYRLKADEGNVIGDSISSNWVTVPLRPSDNMREILIILTPLFESMADYEPEFLIGSHFSLVMDILRMDLAQIFISMLCFFVGMFIIAIQTYFIMKRRSRSLNMVYLGIFSMLLGIWRITDIKSATYLFPENPMVLGYISIGALMLCAPALVMHVCAFYRGRQQIPLLILSTVSITINALILILQLFSIVEFKQALPLCHIMSAITISALLFLSRRREDSIMRRRTTLHFLILAFGVAFDLSLFYATKSSSYIVCTPVAFVIYAMAVFISESLDINRKAYVDVQTGLSNKLRWTEIMQEETPSEKDTCIFMIDLNNLKQVNDTLGHEAGDELIYSFSRILHTAFPSSSVICRWGGDEFTVLLEGRDALKGNAYLKILSSSVEKYNARAGAMRISYAAGYALSTEFPGRTRKQLLSEADARMYTDKRHHHMSMA